LTELEPGLNAIRYDFPTNTRLAPALTSSWPKTPKRCGPPSRHHRLGNFSGKLAKKTDLIELKDAGQRVVSEVPLLQRWALAWLRCEAADRASSWIDPYADGRRAESWAASDDAAQPWETVTYRGVASANKGYPKIGHNNIWNEFVMACSTRASFCSTT
jgi:hypothetical protein